MAEVITDAGGSFATNPQHTNQLLIWKVHASFGRYLKTCFFSVCLYAL